jgi:hypothetical protein
MSHSGRHCDSREDAWVDHVQEKRWQNEGENEGENECENEGEYVSEYGLEDQEQEDCGVDDESFQMFTEEQLQEDCSAEDQSSRMIVDDQEQEESAYRELEILEEAWFNHVQENHWTNGCENEDQEQDISGSSRAYKSPSTVDHKQRAADMEAKVMELEARLLLEEAWLMEAEAGAAAAKARTLELEGILEKQNKQIDELTESLDMMTAWVIEVVQPETSNCLSSS